MRNLSFLFSILLLSHTGFSQEVATKEEAKNEVIPSSAQMAPIWKLSDEDSTVFLAGSVHLLREKDMPIPPAFDRVYEMSEELVFEIDLAKMTDPSMALKIRAAGSLPEGESLAGHLEPETMKSLRQYLTQMQLPPNAFDQFTPGMVYISLGSMEAMRQGAKAELGLETRYYRKSVNDNKPSRGLETAEFQISRFDEIDPETIEKLITETLNDVDKAEETLDEIISAWKSGDEKQITTLIVDRLADTPEVKKVLLDDRNKNWIPEIEEALKSDKNILFIVGAAHLAGEGSVVDFLRKKNYDVQQVKAN